MPDLFGGAFEYFNRSECTLKSLLLENMLRIQKLCFSPTTFILEVRIKVKSDRDLSKVLGRNKV